MTRKTDHIDEDNLVRDYLAGKTAKQLGDQHGVSKIVVYRILKERGIPRRAWPVRRNISAEEVTSLYVSGVSENQIAKQLGCDRNAVALRLREQGIERRGQSAAETIKWASMDAEARKRQVAAANRAARGRKASFEERVKTARTKQHIASHISHYEISLRKMLEDRHVPGIVPQLAIGPYNCDLAADPVAVEVFGGNIHWRGRTGAREPGRIRYLMNSGWYVLMVHIPNRRRPVLPRTADYIAAYIEEARRNPSRRREYRVIRGNGYLLASGSADDDEISIIPTLKVPLYPATGSHD